MSSALPENAAIVTTEASHVTTEAASVTAEPTGVVTSAAASFCIESTSVISVEVASKTIVRLIVSAIAPLDGLGILRLELLKEVRNLLLRLKEDLDEVSTDVLVTVVVEGSGLTFVANAGGATNTVYVLGDAIVLGRRKVIVDDVLHVGDVKTTGGNTSSDGDRAPRSAK